MRGTDPGQLQSDLQTAMTIELSTLPTYLYTAWTIRTETAPARQALQLIMSVVYEEMLHMGLVGNLTNALGLATAVNEPARIPDFDAPLNLPGHSTTENPFLVELRPFGAEAIQTFLDIELPRYDAKAPPSTTDWATIGQFYAGLRRELPLDDSAYRHGRQLQTRDNPGGGVLFAVDSYRSANAAISEIVDQGEGHRMPKNPTGDAYQHDRDHELSHYWKFSQVQTLLTHGQIDPVLDVWPVVALPHHYVGAFSAEQAAANTAFNTAYSGLLDALQAMFASPSPAVFGAPTQYMDVMRQKAAVLRACGPIKGTDRLAGPTFDYIAPSDRAGVAS